MSTDIIINGTVAEEMPTNISISFLSEVKKEESHLLLECLVDGKWSKVVEIYVSDLLEEENISDKDVVTDQEMSNGDSLNMQEDTLSKIEADMSWTFMPTKKTMELISMLGTERTEPTKDGFSNQLEEEDTLLRVIIQENV